ncbi:hypothetical protein [Agromyces sp. Leaf222]|uniref:hypothetical protein n=1 Tax=Agromyces sp. Leaf222 TaxID=1735688 RepID=UPI0006FF344A|nr:hypothetical protein [Agromyces sp. Leaf222]KQM80980.1 hypothetical protein ASE68_18430 [Agromyces sp. Leaf222]
MGSTTSTAIAVGALLVLAGCTPTPDPPATVSPEVHAPEAPLTVIDETDAAAAAIAVSSTLFASSPVAIVSPATADEVAIGSEVAVELGVPLLVAPGGDEGGGSGTGTGDASAPATAPESAPASADASESAAPADGADPLVAELDRLGVSQVVAIEADPSPATEGDAYGDRDIVRVGGSDAASDAADAIDDANAGLDLAHEPSTAVVLATDPDAASTATARAAGATVEMLPADDPNPQRSAGAIEALHAADGGPAIAIGPEFAASEALDWQVRTARTGEQLPGGGQVLFPDRLLIALYGKPDSPTLGVLGEQPLPATVERAAKTAATYDDLTDRTVMPALEIITTLASGAPTPDGDFSSEPDAEDLVPWIEAAGAAGQYVILDLQPGRDSFPAQLEEYRSLLEYPWVGLALDPEWRLDANQRHLVDIGQVEASEVNEVVDELAAICDEHDLPPKLLVLHQFRGDMILHRDRIEVDRPEVSVLFHVDGNGTQPAKQATWNALRAGAPDAAWGWKNFIDEDGPMLTPEQTMSEVSPQPDLVSYQ